MKCDNVKKKNNGPCKKTCNCPKFEFPVCGTNGKNYDNFCFMTCDNAQLKSLGKCPTVKPALCQCANFDSPVCGDNGRTYGNPCLANCSGVFNFTSGPCILGSSLEDDSALPPVE